MDGPYGRSECYDLIKDDHREDDGNDRTEIEIQRAFYHPYAFQPKIPKQRADAMRPRKRR